MQTHTITHCVHVSNVFLAVLISVRSFQLFLTGVIPGSVTLIQTQLDFKDPPNIEFAFISLSGEVQPSEHHLTRSGIQPDLSRNPMLVSGQVSMPLISADVRQLFSCPSGFFIIRKQGCGDSLPSSRRGT